MLKFGPVFLSRCVVNRQRIAGRMINDQIFRYSTNAEMIFANQLKKLQSEKISEAEKGLELIFAHVLNKKKLGDVRRDKLKNIKLTLDQVGKIKEMCDSRVKKYLLKEWKFCNLNFKVQVPVFVPRKVTEKLVELIAQQLDPKRDHKILEVGCGSGCISLALLNSLPKVKKLVAIDQCETACKLTRENAQNLGFSDRINVFDHKIKPNAELPQEISQFGLFDVIVSNPPYLPTSDVPSKEDPEMYEIHLFEGEFEAHKQLKSF